jgi:LytS/YehU family sensor histidine kinase
MLRRQIEPHFLFNTLATIRRLHETDPERGQQLIGRLFHYMSATLAETPNGRSTLAEEVTLVQAYLEVCASRMSGRLSVLAEVEPGLEAMDFPPLVLATLAENAVKHGVFPQDGGTILISARRVGDMVEAAVIDDGVGLSGAGGGGSGGSGLGLANIAERLRLLYGPRAELQLRANAPRGVCALVRIPAPAGAAKWPA